MPTNAGWWVQRISWCHQKYQMDPGDKKYIPSARYECVTWTTQLASMIWSWIVDSMQNLWKIELTLDPHPRLTRQRLFLGVNAGSFWVLPGTEALVQPVKVCASFFVEQHVFSESMGPIESQQRVPVPKALVTGMTVFFCDRFASLRVFPRGTRGVVFFHDLPSVDFHISRLVAWGLVM